MLKQSKIRARVYVLSLYLLLLPIDATLGDIIGSISIVNYIILCYVALRLITLLKEKIEIDSIVKCKMPLIYFIYFMLTILWSITKDLNSWYIYSLMGSFLIFLFSAIDAYSIVEHEFMKKSVVFSGIIVIATVLLNFNAFASSRFVLNIGRIMDPNYFATGFIIITAVLMNNIFEKKNTKINMSILLMIIIIIIMTGSRGGLLSNIAVIVTYIIFKKKNLKNYLPIILIGVISFVIILVFMQDIIPDWVMNRFTLNSIIRDQGSGRTKIWLESLSYYKELSIIRLLFGTGFSSFHYIAFLALGKTTFAHSIYLQSLVEGGFVGFIITIVTIITAMRYAYRNRNIYVFAGLVGAAVGGLTLDIHVSRFFWYILFFSTLPQYKNEDI